MIVCPPNYFISICCPIMKFSVALVAALALCHAYATPVVQSSLYSTLQKGPADVMVILSAQVAPVLASINNRRFATSAKKTTQLVAELRAFTQASQQPILSFLKQRSQNVKSFWITNRISISRASLDIVMALQKNFAGQIAEIREAKVITLDDTTLGYSGVGPQQLEWGVDIIQGPIAWEQGFKGQNQVAGIIDTGVRATHVALAPNRRVSYEWFDGSSEGSLTPKDPAGHGTHVTGTVAGVGGTGVAQEAKWIHCRAFEANGQATEEALLICGQWMTCPSLADGTEEDCSQKPGVVSNSWGGGNEDPFYNDIIDAWRAANIVPVFAIGNSGPGCRTANSPGDQPNLISVGATNAQNLIMSFSSHGPSRTELRIKPEVSAPGNNVRSASNICDQCYLPMSGTSMACPHVAGAVAVLLSKNPEATFDEIKNALEQTAFRVQMGDIVCDGGGVNVTNPWPNNAHGWGNIRVADALTLL